MNNFNRCVSCRNSFPWLACIVSALLVRISEAASGSWTVDSDGGWSTASNWSPAEVPGTAAGDVVALTNDLAAARTVTIDDTSRIAGTLFIGDAASPFYGFALAASGGAGLTFNNGGSFAMLVQTNSTSSSDAISAPLTLADSLIVTNRGTLTVSGGLSGSGKGLTKTGSGTLILSGANTYSGGTSVNGGTLQIGSTDALPVSGNVTLGGSNTVGNLSLSSYSQRVSTFTALSTNASMVNAVTIGSGQTMMIGGSGGLFVGLDSGTNSWTRVTMSGGGALAVTNGSAYVTVGKTQASQNYSNTSTLDLSGLSSVSFGSASAPLKEIRLAYGQTCSGTLTLSNTSNLLAAASLYVAHSVSWNAGSGTLTLGTGTNVVLADTIGIGLAKATGTMKFSSQTAGSAGSVTIGGRTRAAADLVLGSKMAMGSGAVPTGTLDLRGHYADVTAGTVTLGREDNVASPNFTGGGTGSLLFDTGVFTATNLVMGYKVGLNAGSNAKATGTLTLGGGAFIVTDGPITLATQAGAGSAVATMNLNGGVFRAYADILTGPSNCTGTVNLDGGTLDMTRHAVGVGVQTVTAFNAKSGTLMNLGEFNNGAPLVKTGTGTLTLAGTNTYAGATVISGGTLTLGDGCRLGGGNYAADITNNAAFVFDSGVNQTLSGVIAGSGTLTKSGDGTLTLSGSNTYAGATAVSAGLLVGNSGGALANSGVTVAPGAALGVRVLATDAQWSCKSLTLASGTTTVRFIFSGVSPSASVAPLSVDGDLVNNGTLNVAVSGLNVAVGTYPLIAYAGSLTVGALGTVALPNGGVGTLVNNTAAQTIDLSVTTVGTPLVWDGGSGDWDVGTTANWAGGLTYLEGDLVRFDDTSSGTAPFTVNLTSDLNPGSVVVDNATADYTFAGAGSLGGEGGLTKRGAGALTLATVNTYTGGTTLEDGGGTVNATVDATQSGLGSGPVAIGSGATLSLSNGNVSAGDVVKGNAIAGTGLLKLSFADGTAARSTALPGLTGFEGTVQLASAGVTGDKLDAGGVSAPDAAVQIGGGSTLLVGSGTALGAISVSGAGNAEGRGAIRFGTGASTLDSAITLLGDTTIASDVAAATLSGDITGTASAGATNVLTQGAAASSAGCVLSGAIGDGSSGGRVSLAQTQGTLTLSGANTYSGLTTVTNNSALRIGATDTLPTAAAVILGGSNSVGNLVLDAFSQRIASLTALSTSGSGTDLISIGAGQTLTVDGAGGLFVGTDIGGYSTTQLKLTGDGAFVLTNTAANITVGKPQTDEVGNNTCSLDFSGLGCLILGNAAVPINEVRIAYGQYCPGSIKLSDTSNLITAKTLQIGNSNGYVPSGNGTMTLGAGINVLSADKINIGQSKGTGTLGFSSQAPDSSGTVTIGGKTGGVCDISVGDKTGTWTAATPIGTLDLRGHAATVAAGTLTIGKEDHTGVKESGATGYVYFDNGVFTTTNLVMGLNTGNNTGVYARATGTLTVGGGVFTVTTNNAFTLAFQRGGGAASATITLTGGVFRTYSDVLTGPSNCTSVINLSGGTLDMTRHVIGQGAQTVTVFNAQSGTLMNLSQFNNGAPLVKTGTGTLSLDGTNTYSGATVASNGVLRLTGGACLPPTAELYVSSASGATCNLDYTGSLFIRALYVDGVRKKGTHYSQENLPAVFSGVGVIELPFQGTLMRVR